MKALSRYLINHHQLAAAYQFRQTNVDNKAEQQVILVTLRMAQLFIKTIFKQNYF